MKTRTRVIANGLRIPAEGPLRGAENYKLPHGTRDVFLRSVQHAYFKHEMHRDFHDHKRIENNISVFENKYGHDAPDALWLAFVFQHVVNFPATIGNEIASAAAFPVIYFEHMSCMPEPKQLDQVRQLIALSSPNNQSLDVRKAHETVLYQSLFFHHAALALIDCNNAYMGVGFYTDFLAARGGISNEEKHQHYGYSAFDTAQRICRRHTLELLAMLRRGFVYYNSVNLKPVAKHNTQAIHNIKKFIVSQYEPALLASQENCYEEEILAGIFLDDLELMVNRPGHPDAGPRLPYIELDGYEGTQTDVGDNMVFVAELDPSKYPILSHTKRFVPPTEGCGGCKVCDD